MASATATEPGDLDPARDGASDGRAADLADLADPGEGHAPPQDPAALAALPDCAVVLVARALGSGRWRGLLDLSPELRRSVLPLGPALPRDVVCPNGHRLLSASFSLHFT